MVKGVATFPSSQRGGCAREARARQGEASIKGVDGVARSASPIGRSLSRRSPHHFFAELTTPARQLLLSCRAVPPLRALRGGE